MLVPSLIFDLFFCKSIQSAICKALHFKIIKQLNWLNNPFTQYTVIIMSNLIQNLYFNKKLIDINAMSIYFIHGTFVSFSSDPKYFISTPVFPGIEQLTFALWTKCSTTWGTGTCSLCFCGQPAGLHLVRIQTSANDRMLWALDNRGNVHVRVGITEEMPVGTAWEHIPGTSSLPNLIVKPWFTNKRCVLTVRETYF